MERIGPKRPLRLYVAEWRAYRGLTQDQVAARVETTKGNISKQEKKAKAGDISTAWLAKIAYALDARPEDMFHDPATPTADDLLRNATPEQRIYALRTIKAITGTDG